MSYLPLRIADNSEVADIKQIALKTWNYQTLLKSFKQYCVNIGSDYFNVIVIGLFCKEYLIMYKWANSIYMYREDKQKAWERKKRNEIDEVYYWHVLASSLYYYLHVLISGWLVLLTYMTY